MTDVHLRRNESTTEIAQEKMLWDLLELFFVRPATAQGTASEVSKGSALLIGMLQKPGTTKSMLQSQD